MKDDIIYLLVYIFSEIINYMLVYVVIFQVSLSREKKKYGYIISLLLLVHFLTLYYAGLETACEISFFTMILIPAFLFNIRDKKMLLLYPFVVIGSSVIGVSMSFLFAIILNIPEYIVAKENWYTMVCQCIQGFVLILIAICRKMKNTNSYQVDLGWKQYLLFYIVVICLFFLLVPIQTLSEEYYSDSKINVLGFLVSIACIVLVIITIWYGIVTNREKQIKKQIKQNEEYMKLQKEYYLNLLEQDDKMRRFRHDMNSHIIAIKSLNQKGECKELENYLNCIIESSAIYSIEKYTGNNTIDAVMRQLIAEAKKHQIDIVVEGDLPEEIRVSEYDLCTIISNLIKNAIEACGRIEGFSKRKINIIIKNYNDQIFISVKNTFAGQVTMKNNHLVTSKNRYENHGIGSENVKNTVEKYGGLLEYQYDKEWFITEVSI